MTKSKVMRNRLVNSGPEWSYYLKRVDGNVWNDVWNRFAVRGDLRIWRGVAIRVYRRLYAQGKRE